MTVFNSALSRFFTAKGHSVNMKIFCHVLIVAIFLIFGALVCYIPVLQIQDHHNHDDLWLDNVNFVSINSRTYIASNIASTTVLGVLIIDVLFDAIFRIPRDGMIYMIVMLCALFFQSILFMTDPSTNAVMYWAERNTRGYIVMACIYMFLFEFGGDVWNKSIIGSIVIPTCGALTIFLRANFWQAGPASTEVALRHLFCGLCVIFVLYNTAIYYRVMSTGKTRDYRSIDFCCMFYITAIIVYFLYIGIKQAASPTVKLYHFSALEIAGSMYLHMALVVSTVIFNGRSKEFDLSLQIKRVAQIRDSITLHASSQIQSPIHMAHMSLSLLAHRVTSSYLPKISRILQDASCAETRLEKDLKMMDEITKESKEACKIASEIVDALLSGGHSAREDARNIETVGYLLERTLPYYSLIAKAAEVELIVRSDTQVVSEVAVSIHSKKMMQVIGHVISNAINFSPPGSVIEVVTSLGYRKFFKGGAFTDSSIHSSNINCVRISIRDKGCGISKDAQAKLFKVIHPRKDQLACDGAFGLSMCYSIVKMHGGDMGVVSDGEGRGSKFWIDLPLAKKLDVIKMEKFLDAAGNIEKLDNPVKNDLRVLCVDADPDARKFVCRLLTAETSMVRASPDQAEDGEEAVRRIQASMAKSMPYDIVLIKQVMPKMDGPTATQIIREAGFKGLVFGVIESGEASDMTLFKKSGANDVLLKPLDIESIRGVIRKHIRDIEKMNDHDSVQSTREERQGSWEVYVELGIIASIVFFTLFFILLPWWNRSLKFAVNANIETLPAIQASFGATVSSTPFFLAFIFCFSVSLYLTVETCLNWFFGILKDGIFMFLIMIPVYIATDTIYLFYVIPNESVQLGWSVFTMQNYMFLVSTILYQHYFSRDLWGKKLIFFMLTLDSIRIMTRILGRSSSSFNSSNLALAIVSFLINGVQVMRHASKKSRSSTGDICGLAYSIMLFYYDIITIYTLVSSGGDFLSSSPSKVSLIVMLFKVIDVLNIIVLSRLSVIDRKKLFDVVQAKRDVIREVSFKLRTPLNIVSMGVTYLNYHVLSGIDRELECLRLQASSRDTWSEASDALVRELKNDIEHDKSVVVELNKSCVESVAVLNDLLMYERLDSDLLALNKTSCDIFRLVRTIFTERMQVHLKFGDISERENWAIDEKRFAYALDDLVSFASDIFPLESSLLVYVTEVVQASLEKQNRTSLRAVAPTTSPKRSFLHMQISCSVPDDNKAFLRFEGVFYNLSEREEFARGIFDRNMRLNVCNRILKLHGGSLDIKWAKNENALLNDIDIGDYKDARNLSFLVDIPYSSESPSPPPRVTDALQPSSKLWDVEKGRSEVPVEAVRSVERVDAASEVLPLRNSEAGFGLSSTKQRLQSVEVKPLTRVLCVDDSTTSLKMLCRLLPANEICVDTPHTATDGGKAVAMIKESMQRSAPYELVIMDYEMPLMDGALATRICRQAGFQGLIVGLTGNGLQGDINHFLASGADEVMVKPINMDRLKKVLNRGRRLGKN